MGEQKKPAAKCRLCQQELVPPKYLPILYKMSLTKSKRLEERYWDNARLMSAMGTSYGDMRMRVKAAEIDGAVFTPFKDYQIYGLTEKGRATLIRWKGLGYQLDEQLQDIKQTSEKTKLVWLKKERGNGNGKHKN